MFRTKPQPSNRGVIPTEAKRSGGICSAPLGLPKCSVPNPNPQTEVSSHLSRPAVGPKRSVAEGPAVLSIPITAVTAARPPGSPRLTNGSPASVAFVGPAQHFFQPFQV